MATRLTRYEEAYIIGLRCAELSAGDPPKIQLDPRRYYAINEVARLEYENHALSYTLIRQFPNGHTIRYPIQEIYPPH